MIPVRVRIRILKPVELYGRLYGTREIAVVDEGTALELIERGFAERHRPVDLGPPAALTNVMTR